MESDLRRDRLVVLAALAALAALCWAYLIWLSASAPMDPRMNDSTDGSMVSMSPELAGWSPLHFVTMLLMWSVMMVGMMTPSAAPMILVYARVARYASVQGRPFAPSAWFALGYFLAWTGFAILATLLQWRLEATLLLSPMMAGAGSLLGGALLIVAGLYQWTPQKQACLSQCQSPFAFIQRHGGFRQERSAALRLGLRHGGYCVGCCWALMILLFVAGVMNLLWIAAIGALVLAEKLIAGRRFQRMTGAALFIGGVALLV